MSRSFPSHAPDDELVDRFAAAMRPLAPTGLTRDKAREGLGNLLEFVALLERWDADDRAASVCRDTTDSATDAPAADREPG